MSVFGFALLGLVTLQLLARDHPVSRFGTIQLGRLASGLILASSVIYRLFCPIRVQRFSRDAWCASGGHPIHYWPIAWRLPFLQLLASLCYWLGIVTAAFLAILLIRDGVWRIILGGVA